MKARIKNKREFIEINKTLKANIKSIKKMTPKQQSKLNIIINNRRKQQGKPKKRIIALFKSYEIKQKNIRRKKHG